MLVTYVIKMSLFQGKSVENVFIIAIIQNVEENHKIIKFFRETKNEYTFLPLKKWQ